MWLLLLSRDGVLLRATPGAKAEQTGSVLDQRAAARDMVMTA